MIIIYLEDCSVLWLLPLRRVTLFSGSFISCSSICPSLKIKNINLCKQALIVIDITILKPKLKP